MLMHNKRQKKGSRILSQVRKIKKKLNKHEGDKEKIFQ